MSILYNFNLENIENLIMRGREYFIFHHGRAPSKIIISQEIYNLYAIHNFMLMNASNYNTIYGIPFEVNKRMLPEAFYFPENDE